MIEGLFDYASIFIHANKKKIQELLSE
jgi:hypothetical protein